ncbi:MAG: addiction module toxin RelE [Muribaculaceae bacterium]|nr:addiction module toxin RelE [Muribaculaceae bacterium]
MNFEVKTTSEFDKSAKSLAKKYRSFKDDLRDLIVSLEVNPDQGTELSPGIRKIRMAISSKGRGKSGGARVITFTIIVSENTGKVYLMDIYDKADYSTVDVRIIQKKLTQLGLV